MLNDDVRDAAPAAIGGAFLDGSPTERKSPLQRAYAIVDEIAARHGVERADVLRPCRKAKVVAAKKEAIKAVAAAFDDWSLSHLGR